MKRSRTVALTPALFLLGACGDSGTDPGPVDRPNQSPIVTNLTITAPHDLSFSRTLFVEDPDGDPVTLSLRSPPEWVSFDAATATVSGIPGLDNVGKTVTITIEASDGVFTSTGTLSVQVTVGTSSLVIGGPWPVQTPHPFRHDGEPLESEHFIVYNDFSGPGVKQQMADLLEELFVELSERMGVESDDEYEFPPGGKLHVYVDRFQGDGALGYSSTVNGWAFRDGFIVMAPDAPRYSRLGYTEERYRGLVMHELMHDVEFLLIGRNRSIGSTDAWFREGIATYVTGLAPGGVPLESATTSTMNQWRSTHANTPGGGNPIGIHLFSDIPSSVTQTDSYYFWFAQAVRYMSEEDGFGIGDLGLRGVYDDIRAGLDFATSFQNRTGTSLVSFEADFWSLMEEFLPGG